MTRSVRAHLTALPRRAAASLLSLALTAAGATLPGAEAQESDVAGTPGIELVVEGLRGGGRVRAGAYRDASTWLGEGTAIAVCTPPVRAGRASCVLRVPGPGSYAIAFFHDADDDGEMDRGAFGIPTEGYGFSRNVGGGLSAPSFREAALEVGEDGPIRAVVRVRYGL
jgi:uncharacterized protein (DUF2141 family)